MGIEKTMTDQSILALLGQRISDLRLARNLTQEDLAIQAGVSKSTVVRTEDGRSTQLVNLIRILRALELLDNLDALIPVSPVSPVELLKIKGKKRQRASRKKASEPAPKKWIWGDEK